MKTIKNLIHRWGKNPPFITEWTVLASDTIVLPLDSNGSYDFLVNYGDGTDWKQVSAYNDANATHLYTLANTYEVKILGRCSSFTLDAYAYRNKITKVTQWGHVKCNSMNFNGANLLTVTATDTLDTSQFTTFLTFFKDCWELQLVPNMDNWDTSNVTNLNSIFFRARKFNDAVGSWNTAKVTNMDNVFNNADWFNQPLTNWTTPLVTGMQSMFYEAYSFNYSLAHFYYGNVASMHQMMARAYAFDQDVSGRDTSSCGNMYALFHAITNDFDLRNWDISGVGNMNLLVKGISSTNYTALLETWRTLPSVQNAAYANFGTSKYVANQVHSGTTDGTTANKLVHSGQNFLTTVTVNDVVHNTLNNTWAVVTAKDSDTVLSLSVDIMISGDSYSIENSAAAKAKASFILDDNWTIIDAGIV